MVKYHVKYIILYFAYDWTHACYDLIMTVVIEWKIMFSYSFWFFFVFYFTSTHIIYIFKEFALHIIFNKSETENPFNLSLLIYINLRSWLFFLIHFFVLTKITSPKNNPGTNRHFSVVVFCNCDFEQLLLSVFEKYFRPTWNTHRYLNLYF